MTTSRTQFTVAILCPGCNQLGAVVLEEDLGTLRESEAKPRLVQVAGAFHIERGGPEGSASMIVCNECDTIQGE